MTKCSMAREIAPEDWIPGFRSQIRATTGPGWSVSQFRGKTRLQVTNNEGTREQAVLKEYIWSKENSADLLLRVRQIYLRVQEGESLKAACALAAASSSKNPEDWSEAVSRFKEYKLRIEGNVSDNTWKAKYEPVLSAVVRHQESLKRSNNSTDLAEIVLSRWDAGSRQRKISRQNLNSFLQYCVDRINFKSRWLPKKGPKEISKPKCIGYPISDEQILRLLDGLPTTGAAERWRFAIELVATYGLRPEELRYLKVTDGIDGKELWCMYRKKSGGGMTLPRRLLPLFIKDSTGQVQDWKLIERLSQNEEIPPIGKAGHGGESLGTYLKNKAIWKELKEEVLKGGDKLVPYSFRHRYAKQSHQKGLQLTQISEAMGHSVGVHTTSYARFTPSGTAEAYAQANK